MQCNTHMRTSTYTHPHNMQDVTDETLKKLDATYLRDMKLQGVENIQKVC